MRFFSGCFWDFLLSLVLSNLILVCLGVIIFMFLLLSIEFLGSAASSFHQIWKIFSHYFFKFNVLVCQLYYLVSLGLGFFD